VTEFSLVSPLLVSIVFIAYLIKRQHPALKGTSNDEFDVNLSCASTL